MSDTPSTMSSHAYVDLVNHIDDFDAIVVGGDHHAITLGAIIASRLGKPLMIVCQADHECVISHITVIGEIKPDMRFLYVDDFYSFGATKAKTFAYFNQSDRANIVHTYEYTTRTYH